MPCSGRAAAAAARRQRRSRRSRPTAVGADCWCAGLRRWAGATPAGQFAGDRRRRSTTCRCCGAGWSARSTTRRRGRVADASWKLVVVLASSWPSRAPSSGRCARVLARARRLCRQRAPPTPPTPADDPTPTWRRPRRGQRERCAGRRLERGAGAAAAAAVPARPRCCWICVPVARVRRGRQRAARHRRSAPPPTTRAGRAGVVQRYVACRVVHVRHPHLRLARASAGCGCCACRRHWAAEFLDRWIRRSAWSRSSASRWPRSALLFGMYRPRTTRSEAVRAGRPCLLVVVVLQARVPVAQPAARPPAPRRRAGQPAEPLRPALAPDRDLLHRGALAGRAVELRERLRPACCISSSSPPAC